MTRPVNQAAREARGSCAAEASSCAARGTKSASMFFDNLIFAGRFGGNTRVPAEDVGLVRHRRSAFSCRNPLHENHHTAADETSQRQIAKHIHVRKSSRLLIERSLNQTV